MKHLNITVKGRVQGVGFRWSAQRAANTFGVKGMVKNMSDGSVYIEAEGSELQLSEFIKWCNNGPPMAHVSTVTFIEGNLKNFTEFSLAY